MKWLRYLLFCLVTVFAFSAHKAEAQIGPLPCGSVFSTSTWRQDYGYAIGQVVIYNGVTYQSIVNNNLNQNPCTFVGTAWTTVIGTGMSGGGSPSGPPYTIQFANPGLSTFGSDANITINPITHTLSVAGAGTGIVGLIDATTGHQVTTTVASGTTAWTFTLPSGPPAGNGYCETATVLGVASWIPCSQSQLSNNPLSFGTSSQGSIQTVSATANSGATHLTLSNTADFVAQQGIMISHGGVACGSVRGQGCATAPMPTVTPSGTTGSTTYTYQLACIDGLGGVGVAGNSGTTVSGNASLAGVVTGAGPITGNYNIVTWTGNACSEVAIYKNGSLIASEYSAPSGTMTFNDVGLPAWSSRDIPSAPLVAAVNDNYDGMITALSGTTATVSPAITVGITAATMYHDDTPLFQAAVSNGNSKFVQMSPGFYIMRYPLNYTKVSSSFNNAGAIYGTGANIECDTGDMCIDATGSQNVVFQGFSLTGGSTNGASSTGIFLSRDTSTSALAQNIVTYSLTISIGNEAANTFSQAYGGRGRVGIYNYAAEIQHNYDTQFQVDRWMVLTSDDVDHVSSLFSSTGLNSVSNSMSQVDCYSCNGSGYVFGEFENAFTVNYINGYGLGGGNFTDFRHPWAFEEDPSDTGRIRIVGFRVEGKEGLLSVAAGAQLNEPELNADLYRQPGYANTAQLYLNAGASVNYATLIKSDDYGGSNGQVAPIIDGPSGNCGVAYSTIFIGIQESQGTCPLTGVGNTLTGPGYGGDVSLLPDYVLNESNTSATWVKLGTWIQNLPQVGGDNLGIRIFSGNAFNAANTQSTADINIRGSNGSTSVPNLDGGTLSYFGTPAIDQLKMVATGGSTSPTNKSWDIYVHEPTSFSGGIYNVDKANVDQWININALTTDPGAAGSTILVGINQQLEVAFSGTTGALATTAITAGACQTLTAMVPGAATNMTVSATPASSTALIFGLHWDTAYISAANTVTVPVCNITAASVTPNIGPAFNVRVTQ